MLPATLRKPGTRMGGTDPTASDGGGEEKPGERRPASPISSSDSAFSSSRTPRPSKSDKAVGSERTSSRSGVRRIDECEECEERGEQQFQLSREDMEREYASKAAANCFAAWTLEAEAFATEEARFDSLNAALQLSNTVSGAEEPFDTIILPAKPAFWFLCCSHGAYFLSSLVILLYLTSPYCHLTLTLPSPHRTRLLPC